MIEKILYMMIYKPYNVNYESVWAATEWKLCGMLSEQEQNKSLPRISGKKWQNETQIKYA